MQIPVKSSLALALALALPLGAAADEEKVVRVYNWSDYIDDSLLAEFTEKTGIQVVYDVFDSNEVLETKLLAGGSGYDVVVPTASFLERQIQAGVFQPLDDSKLPNRSNMWDAVTTRLSTYKDVNEHSINYMWGTTGLGYVESKILERMPDAPLNSWDLLFKPENAAKFADCGIYVLDAPDETVPAALKYLGLDPNSSDPDDLKKAEELWLSVRPHVRKFHSSEYIDALANGDICLVLGWSGDILQAQYRAVEAENGVDILYVIPKEGALMWFDQMAIPKDAPHPDNAHAFLNFIMDPQVVAKATNYIAYANGNKASQEYVDEAILNDPAVYPDAETLENLYTKGPYDSKTQRIVTRLWTKVKSGI